MSRLADEARMITDRYDNYKTLYDDIVNYVMKNAKKGENSVVYIIDGVTYSSKTYEKVIRMLVNEGFNCTLYDDYPGYRFELKIKW